MPDFRKEEEDKEVGLHLFHRIGGTPVARSIGKQKDRLMPAFSIPKQTINGAVISCAMHKPFHRHKSM